jgi:hypothetical protein
MKLAVFGSRHIKDRKRVYKEIDEIRKEYDVTVIVSGVSLEDTNDTGPDTYGRDYALENGLGYVGYPAEWDNLQLFPCKIKYTRFGKPYNSLAGLNRNTFIAEDGDIGLSIWDGKSKGTKDTLDKMEAQNKYVKIVII